MTEPIRPAKLADAIADRLEQLILEGSLRPGERLLPERDLAQKLDVSRPSLREALDKLERKGLVYSGRGSATYVAALLGESFTGPLAAVLRSRPETTFDYLEFRTIVEGSAAYFAALRGTEVDREIIRERFESMEQAHGKDDPSEEAGVDALFHLAIYEASHNLVMLHIMRSLSEMLRHDVFYNRAKLYMRPGVREMLLEQHRAVYLAVMAGDPEAARAAAEAHITFTRDALMEIAKADARLEVSLRRIVGALASDPPVAKGDVESALSEALPPIGDTFATLLRSHPETAFDYLEFRGLLAGEATAFAAQRASPAEVARIGACLKAMEQAHALDDPEQEAAADAHFHLAIYEGVHNQVMLHIMRPLFEMLRLGVFYERTELYLRRGVREVFLRQHQAIYQAIAAGDAEGARAAASAHLASTAEALREAQWAAHRREVSGRRRNGSGLVSNGRSRKGD